MITIYSYGSMTYCEKCHNLRLVKTQRYKACYSTFIILCPFSHFTQVMGRVHGGDSGSDVISPFPKIHNYQVRAM